MSPCPEFEKRAAMSDGEFWEHVLLGGTPDDEPVEPPVDLMLDDPCVVCGAPGACAWDVMGRPLIHAGELEDE